MSTVQSEVHVAQLNAAASGAAEQVRRCYRSPKVPTVGRRISTRLRVRYSKDGSLVGLPLIVAQNGITRENSAYAGEMAQAAALAVMRCAPVKLPPALYKDGWSEVVLTFSPRLMA